MTHGIALAEGALDARTDRRPFTRRGRAGEPGASAGQDGWRRTITRAIQAGIAVPTMTASLAYYDSLRRARLPANLTQAQRDFFGAHTYQRLDKEGSFHTAWG